MRSASMFYSRFWISGTGRALLKDYGKEHALVAIYLFTGPLSHMSGLYYLPASTIAEHNRLTVARVRKILDDLERIGFVRYDHAASMAWVVSMARWQISDTLRDSDNRVRGLRRYLKSLPRSVLVEDFRRAYAINLDDPQPIGEAAGIPGQSPFAGAAEPLRRAHIPTLSHRGPSPVRKDPEALDPERGGEA